MKRDESKGKRTGESNYSITRGKESNGRVVCTRLRTTLNVRLYFPSWCSTVSVRTTAERGRVFVADDGPLDGWPGQFANGTRAPNLTDFRPNRRRSNALRPFGNSAAVFYVISVRLTSRNNQNSETIRSLRGTRRPPVVRGGRPTSRVNTRRVFVIE